MGILSIFGKNNKSGSNANINDDDTKASLQQESDAVTVCSATSRSSASRSSRSLLSKPKRTSSGKSGKKKSKDKDNKGGTAAAANNISGAELVVSFEDDEKTINVRAAEEFMRVMNTYDPNQDPEVYTDAFDNCFESADSNIILEDGECYKPAACGYLLYVTYLSFPDFKFTYEPVHESNLRNNNANKIYVEGVYATGTHTGKPYTIMPGKLPEIQPSGNYCYNDEQRFELYMKNGKIQRFDVFAMGNCTGFAGFYTRAGGSLAPLAAAAAPAPEPAPAPADAESTSSAPKEEDSGEEQQDS